MDAANNDMNSSSSSSSSSNGDGGGKETSTTNGNTTNGAAAAAAAASAAADVDDAVVAPGRRSRRPTANNNCDGNDEAPPRLLRPRGNGRTIESQKQRRHAVPRDDVHRAEDDDDVVNYEMRAIDDDDDEYGDDNDDYGDCEVEYNHAKRDEWHDIGRFLPPPSSSSSSSDGRDVDREAAIERNACMLEDLLATALEYDEARRRSRRTKASSSRRRRRRPQQRPVGIATSMTDAEAEADPHGSDGVTVASSARSAVVGNDDDDGNDARHDTRTGRPPNNAGSTAPQQPTEGKRRTKTTSTTTDADSFPRSSPMQQHRRYRLLSPSLRSQIRSYVSAIASRYHRVGFHSFEHASHVTMSAAKIAYMLQERRGPRTERTVGQAAGQARRCRGSDDDDCDSFGEGAVDACDGGVTENDDDGEGERPPPSPVVDDSDFDDDFDNDDLSGTLHDPWLHFAIALSALLHDVDHKGLPNSELLAERDPLSAKYGGEECMSSYAEWNSVEIGLSTLRGGEEYAELAAALGGCLDRSVGEEEDGDDQEEERRRRNRERENRFYATVTDLILCTDIASKERREMGMRKWKSACDDDHDDSRVDARQRTTATTTTPPHPSSSSPEATRAVSEQIMQAADVSHTMQRFSTFVRWNARLYREVLAAHRSGRTKAGGLGGGGRADTTGRHPGEGWYESQVGFFDHYVIPLAERLDACRAFDGGGRGGGGGGNGPPGFFAEAARRNKFKWMLEGEECTRAMVEEAEGMSLPPPVPAARIMAEDGAGEGAEDDGEEGPSSLSSSTDGEEWRASISRGSPSPPKNELDVDVEAVRKNVLREEWDQDDLATYFTQTPEMLRLVDVILEKRPRTSHRRSVTAGKTRTILVRGSNEGCGARDAFVSALSRHPSLLLLRAAAASSPSFVALEARDRPRRDEPFHCLAPVVTRALLSYSETRRRLADLASSSSSRRILDALLENEAMRTPASFPPGAAVVDDDDRLLAQYLPLANDLVYRGFPLLGGRSPEEEQAANGRVHVEPEGQRTAEKCAEALAASIARYLGATGRPAILPIRDLDCVDDCSRKLLRRLARSGADLVIVVGVDVSIDSDAPEGGDLAASVLGDYGDAHVEIHDLPLLAGHGPARAPVTRRRRGRGGEGRKGNDDDDGVPADLAETAHRRVVDRTTPRERTLLGIASVAGFGGYDFSRHLLETVSLALSKGETPVHLEEDRDRRGNGGARAPNSAGPSDESEFVSVWQADHLDRTLDSLVDRKFLDEVKTEMSDHLGIGDSATYRFHDVGEQSVANSLLSDNRRKRTHSEMASYYSSALAEDGTTTRDVVGAGADDGGGGANDDDPAEEEEEFPTLATVTDWRLSRVVALHRDGAGEHLPAALAHHDASASLSRLGATDEARAGLRSAYLSLGRVLRGAAAASSEATSDEAAETRRRIAGEIVRRIGDDGLRDEMRILTRDHLRLAFDGDISAFRKCLVILTNFGQSLGMMEEDGRLLGSEVYLQAILLVLLVMKDEALANLTSSLGPFLGQLHIKFEREEDNGNINGDDHDDHDHDDEGLLDSFIIEDLTVSFPAFSGLLAFYNNLPTRADPVQEMFLANLFVAVAQEANETIHVLRTKCILSHLYLKYGKIAEALEECEGIRGIYDHDAHSLGHVAAYGMDWSLICIAAMASTHLYRGQFAAARRNVDFLKAQLTKLDECASGTWAMSKGTMSSFYLLLHEFEEAAEIASGIAATQYGYFFKPIGTLQEELANRELALHQHKAIDGSTRDLDLLSVLSSYEGYDIDRNRSDGMLNQSAETLSDRGIEAVKAALCATEIRNLELQPNRNLDVVRKQVQYCQAGLRYLEQSLGQDDAKNHERRKNYMMCLYQRAHLMCWHHKLLQLLQDRASTSEDVGEVTVNDVLEIKGAEIDLAKKSLSECRELSITYDYPFMQLLAGKSCIKLGFDVSGGEALIQRALEGMDSSSDCEVAKAILSQMDDLQGVVGRALKPPMPPTCQRGVPSAA